MVNILWSGEKKNREVTGHQEHQKEEKINRFQCGAFSMEGIIGPKVSCPSRFLFVTLHLQMLL